MQIDGVRHDGCADDADGEQQRVAIGKLRQHRMQRCRAPIDRSDEHLDEVAKPDNANQATDDQLDGPEPGAFEHQDAVGYNRRDDHPCEERHLEQQGKPYGAAEKLGQIGRHGGNLADHPHRPDNRLGKLLAAHLRQVPSGDDTKFGGEGLEQHRDQIGEQHHPKQSIAVLRPRLDIGREITWVLVGD